MTNNDLAQIRGIVQEETRKIVETETRKIVQEETRKVVQEEIAPIKNDISKIQKDIGKIQKDVAAHADYFDSKYLDHEKRLKHVEDQLGINPLF